MDFEIDRRLLADSHLLFRRNRISYLLHANAEVLWLILVPHTNETEFYRLPPRMQKILCSEMNRLSNHLRAQFDCDKINLATIGNVVEQMHIHIVARRRDDAFWPDVVWGKPILRRHPDEMVERMQRLVRDRTWGQTAS
jgi:diadenosine tetraphosphate (Ap4A) HIT family hydrolase